jgi:hypothetical protein
MGAAQDVVHGWIGGAGAASWTLTLALGDLYRLNTLEFDGLALHAAA